MAQITLNTKITSESFSFNDDEIVFVDVNYTDGVADGSILTVMDTAGVDTLQKIIEESPSAIAALTTKLAQITLTSNQTPYIAISRVIDIVTDGSYSYIMYDDAGNTHKRLDTLMTTSEVLDAINSGKNEPLIWKGLVYQVDAGAPVEAAVNRNDLSDSITWAYFDSGIYTGTLTGAFTSNKVHIYLTPSVNGSSVSGVRVDANTIRISAASGGTADDNLLGTAAEPASLTIEVWP